MTRAVAKPSSAVPLSDGIAGLAGLALSWLAIMAWRPPTLVAVWIVLTATAMPMLIRELRRAPARGDRPRLARPSVAWLLGFAAASLPFMAVYVQSASTPVWLIDWMVVAPLFLVRLRLRSHVPGVDPDGLPVLLGRWLVERRRDAPLWPAARLWALKAFFLPIYAASFYLLIDVALTHEAAGAQGWLVLALTFAYTIDLGFALAGYMLADNKLVPTVRSTQPRFTGWLVCLVCYAPVFAHWPAFGRVVHNEIRWPLLIHPDTFTMIASGAMMALLLLYISATVAFGLRFSNLTNRGIVTSGPYRWMKHPAYAAHVGNAWIITLILLPGAGVSPGFSGMLVPIAFTLFYWARAATEEQHLRDDPDYLAYAEWIARHGLLARLRSPWRRPPVERPLPTIG